MEKRFDSLKMVREIRDKNREKMKAKSARESSEYYQQKAAPVLKLQECPKDYNS